MLARLGIHLHAGVFTLQWLVSVSAGEARGALSPDVDAGITRRPRWFNAKSTRQRLLRDADDETRYQMFVCG